MVQEPLFKIQELITTFQIVPDKRRQRFLGELVCACISGRSVVFSELAHHIDRPIKVESIERRIQDFFQKVSFDYEALLALLLCFFPKEKLILSMDRTEWDRGTHQYNILCVVASIGKMAIPLYFELLDNNSGNSNKKDRIAIILKLFIHLPNHRIDYLIMDREFIGQDWLKWLKVRGVKFCVRVPKHHLITTREGQKIKAEEQWARYKNRTQIFKDALVDGVSVTVSLSTAKNGELLFLIGTIEDSPLQKIYQKRWGIEVFFQATKGRGFNIEQTGLRSNGKLRKLFALTSLAYVLCWATGIEKGKKQAVLTKKHGYPQYSVFRRGLNYFREKLKQENNEFIDLVILKVKQRANRLFGISVG